MTYSVNDNWGDTSTTIADCMMGFTGAINAEDAARIVRDFQGENPGMDLYGEYRRLIQSNDPYAAPPFTSDELDRWLRENDTWSQ